MIANIFVEGKGYKVKYDYNPTDLLTEMFHVTLFSAKEIGDDSGIDILEKPCIDLRYKIKKEILKKHKVSVDTPVVG